MINLLPLEEKKRTRTMYFIRLGVVAAALLFASLVIGAISILPSFFLVSVKEERLSAQAEETKARLEAAGEEETRETIRLTNEKADILALDDGSTLSVVIDAVIREKGPRMELDGFFFQKREGEALKKIRIRGISPDRETLITFSERLKQSPHFESVDLPVSNLRESENISFSLTAVLKEREEKYGKR